MDMLISDQRMHFTHFNHEIFLSYVAADRKIVMFNKSLKHKDKFGTNS